MLKGNRKYYLVFVAILACLVGYQYLSPKPLNWNRTYLSSHKIPYGTNALYQLMQSGFLSNEVIKEDQSVYSFLSLREKRKGGSTYMFIDQSLNFDQLDTRELMKFAEEGNTVFLSAGAFRGKLADTFNIRTDIGFVNFLILKKDSSENTSRKTIINFTNPNLKSKIDYVYTDRLQDNYFSSFDTARTIILAQSTKKTVNLISIPHGKGKFIFSCLPDAYTNYWIVNERNREYAYKSLSYAANPVVYIDEHYKSGRQKSDSPMGYIIANDSLYAAWILAILSLLFFMIFETKRRQRTIPVVEPLKNTTLEFVEVVGSVYYSSKNHKTIAEEKIVVYLEFIRNKFQVSTQLFDDAFFRRVATLSGLPQAQIVTIFEVIDRTNFKQSISEAELIELNKLIENFYKNNKR